ncbi:MULTISPECIES: ribonuclease D [unclassified Luteimonas]|uniref:ribonuclease D n=1 Tax=unclassified Luteimonas TaxID=2629088 RepID=UPI0018F0B194|nr:MULTISPECIES: ribonuclease D [unclassified Luteimonas]MBJ6979532.1 ribonuclease D [Luteimonas sp. MC1895]MBJ6983182.1 ribonuclease D [Luteimonas sp. MC1750]QQO05118.1 ribonuclease D [Luteimonas sp. MC1750]
MEPDYIWVAEPAALLARFDTPPPRIGLDTEFIRERTWWPHLALAQMAVRDEILLLDMQAPGMADALRGILLDAGIVKVMHSASEDLIAFHHACGAVPEPLFDTQVAAAVAGLASGAGYQRLVADVTGVALGKGETRSDWTRRPLSDAQLAYAADDVRHLFELHDHLQAKLEALGRLDWLREDCARMVANARDQQLERWPHLPIRAAQGFDRAAQLRLLRLLRWRDAWAREHDRPRSWVLDNELATAVARSVPTDQAALKALFDRHPKAPRKLLGEVWTALATPLDDEADAPLVRTDEPDKRAVRRLQDAVAARSAELGLPDGVLASRRRLEALLDDGDWAALGGWRRTQLEALLAPLLADATGRLPTGPAHA